MGPLSCVVYCRYDTHGNVTETECDAYFGSERCYCPTFRCDLIISLELLLIITSLLPKPSFPYPPRSVYLLDQRRLDTHPVDVPIEPVCLFSYPRLRRPCEFQHMVYMGFVSLHFVFQDEASSHLTNCPKLYHNQKLPCRQRRSYKRQ